MLRRRIRLDRMTLLLLAAAAASPAAPARQTAAASARYEDLLKLFEDWRAFQKPRLLGGVPDYSSRAMSAQHAELARYQRRLKAIDASGWSVDRQADWHVVRAEMNGLDFDHRVLRPWANNPAFYVTVFPDQSDQPAREGPFAYGAVELWSYTFPLAAADAARVDAGVKTIPALLEQARTNLVGTQKDIWTFGTKAIQQQAADLGQLAGRVADGPAELKADVSRAREATQAFAAWLDSQAATKTAPSGIGVVNYDWYLKNVQLVPYTWRDEVALMEAELARSYAFLAFEEKRNEGLPPLAIVSSPEEHAQRFGAAVTAYMRFLKERDILTVKGYMDPWLRGQIGSFVPGPREFFTEVDYRDPEVLRTHGFHWFDKGQMANEPHADPIRRGPLLYNIFNTRTEGFATAWEETMLQAGMFDASPRSRELIYILVAERAARALGDLRMHSNEYTLEQASAFAAANTPRDWLRLEMSLVRSEQHLYLQQPAYGTCYLIGKLEAEKLVAERQRKLGERFAIRPFMDEFLAAGLIPASLVRWQISGELTDDLRKMLQP